MDTRRLAEHVGASSEEVYAGLAQIAGFLVQLEIVHTINLALLPMIGLLFTSLTRRAKRRAAGVEAPPESAQARRADRLVRIVVVTVAVIATAGTLALLAIVLVSIGLS